MRIWEPPSLKKLPGNQRKDSIRRCGGRHRRGDDRYGRLRWPRIGGCLPVNRYGVPMSNTLRTFIAVPIPHLIGEWLQDIQAQLQKTASDVRWVKKANIHLTLRFIGDIAPGQVGTVARAMNRCLIGGIPFRIAARGAGVFPNLRRARVIWVGLDGNTSALAAMHAQLGSALAHDGFKPEHRPFSPHLTIGRVPGRIAPGLLRKALQPLSKMASSAFTVDRLVLYRSRLKPSGAEYSVLHTARYM